MTTQAAGAPAPVEVQMTVAWPTDALDGLKFANTFGVFPGLPAPSGGALEQTVYFVAGQFTPPVLTTEEDIRAFAESGGRVPVRPVVALAIPVERAEELRDVLNAQIALVRGQTT